MARPTKKTYLIVLAAFVVICGVGGYLAVSWRSLAAGYYLRRAQNPQADHKTICAALEKALRCDRKRVIEFWERELAELDGLEESKGSADGLCATLRVLEPVRRWEKTPAAERTRPESFALLFSVLNRTDQALPLPRDIFGESENRAYIFPTWAAERRRPEDWETASPEALMLQVSREYSIDTSSLSPDSGHARHVAGDILQSGQKTGGVSCVAVRVQMHFRNGSFVGEIFPPPGLYRFRIRWPKYRGGKLATNWVTVVVLPSDEAPEPTPFPMPMWGGPGTDRGGSDR